MITSKLVTPDGHISICNNTSYSSIKEASTALLNDWPTETFSAHNVSILADTDGSRLILQERKSDEFHI